MGHTNVGADATLFALQQLHSTRRRLQNLLAGIVHHEPVATCPVPLADCSMARPVNCFVTAEILFPVDSALLWLGCHAAIQLSSCFPVIHAQQAWLVDS